MAPPQGTTPRTNGKVITILSIDGGGVRGIIPATILHVLEAELQKIDGPNARTVDYFDVIAGTSTGSIVTALLTTPYTPPNPSSNASQTNPPPNASKTNPSPIAFQTNPPPNASKANPPPNASQTNPPPNASKTNRPREAKEIPEFYRKHGPAIFHKDKAADDFSISGDLFTIALGFVKNLVVALLKLLVKIRYDNSSLQHEVDEQLGDIRLADTLTNVLIPAYDVQHLKLVTFSSHQERNNVLESSVLLRDAVLGSAAAPVYFRCHHFKADGNIYNLVDGGMAANNPTLLAIREAINIFGNPDDNRYLVISLGTGAEKEHRDFVNLDSPYSWLLDIKRGTPPLVSVLFETSDDMVDTYTSMFLGTGQNSRHQFLRIQDHTLNPEQLTMDDATDDNFNNLTDIANQLLKKPVSSPSSWIGIDPTTTNGAALTRFAEELSKIRKLSDEKKPSSDSTKEPSDEMRTRGSSSSYGTGFLMYSIIPLLFLLFLYKLYVKFHH